MPYQTFPHQAHQYRETGFRFIKISGVSLKISDQKGAILIFGKPEYAGQIVSLKELPGTPLLTQPVFAAFQPWFINGQMISVAKFHRQMPGSYYLSSPINLHSYHSVAIKPGWVEVVNWID